MMLCGRGTDEWQLPELRDNAGAEPGMRDELRHVGRVREPDAERRKLCAGNRIAHGQRRAHGRDDVLLHAVG